LDFHDFQAGLERKALPRILVFCDDVVTVITLVTNNGSDFSALFAQLLEFWGFASVQCFAKPIFHALGGPSRLAVRTIIFEDMFGAIRPARGEGCIATSNVIYGLGINSLLRRKQGNMATLSQFSSTTGSGIEAFSGRRYGGINRDRPLLVLFRPRKKTQEGALAPNASIDNHGGWNKRRLCEMVRGGMYSILGDLGSKKAFYWYPDFEPQ
jgi:hypothetical protein